MLREILIHLFIIQEKTIKTKFNCSYKPFRINPYNPLSYIFITCVFVVGIVLYGIVGFWKETDLKNPFKYQ